MRKNKILELSNLLLITQLLFQKWKLEHFIFIFGNLEEANPEDKRALQEIHCGTSLSLLRFCSFFPADKAFYDAGMSSQEAAKLFSGQVKDKYTEMSVILLNRFCDLYEGASNPVYGNIKNDKFQQSDVPPPQLIPLASTAGISDEKAQQARQWILTTLYSLRTKTKTKTQSDLHVSSMLASKRLLSPTSSSSSSSAAALGGESVDKDSSISNSLYASMWVEYDQHDKDPNNLSFPMRNCLRCKQQITWFSVSCIYCRHGSLTSCVSGLPIDIAGTNPRMILHCPKFPKDNFSSNANSNLNSNSNPNSSLTNSSQSSQPGQHCQAVGLKREWKLFQKLTNTPCPNCYDE